MISQVFACQWGGDLPNPSLDADHPHKADPLDGDILPPRYGQQAGGTHPTEMHTCQLCASVCSAGPP